MVIIIKHKITINLEFFLTCGITDLYQTQTSNLLNKNSSLTVEKESNDSFRLRRSNSPRKSTKKRSNRRFEDIKDTTDIKLLAKRQQAREAREREAASQRNDISPEAQEVEDMMKQFADDPDFEHFTNDDWVDLIEATKYYMDANNVERSGSLDSKNGERSGSLASKNGERNGSLASVTEVEEDTKVQDRIDAIDPRLRSSRSRESRRSVNEAEAPLNKKFKLRSTNSFESSKSIKGDTSDESEDFEDLSNEGSFCDDSPQFCDEDMITRLHKITSQNVTRHNVTRENTTDSTTDIQKHTKTRTVTGKK